MPLRSILIALLLSVTGCATAPPPPPRPNVYVMRHLHTPAGAPDPDLTAEGQRHALLLSDWLRRDPPVAIYASSTKRAQQTVAPLAARLKVAPKIYNPADTPGLLGQVLQERGTVLVVGHSNTVPEIVGALGGQRPAPLSHKDFADIWRVAGPERATTHARLRD